MVTIICDTCGKECTEVIYIDHLFGYYSDLDGDKVSIQICESCFLEKFKKEIKNFQEYNEITRYNSEEYNEFRKKD